MTTEYQDESIDSIIVARALRDEAFKQALLRNSAVAKAEIERELGEALPEGLSINVVQESPNTAYIVLPYMPLIEGISEEQLESIAGGRRFLTNTQLRAIRRVPNPNIQKV
jgi:hypothetical protein